MKVSDLKYEYEKLIDDCIKLLTPLSQSRLNWRPSSNSWSIADCVSHLIYSGNTYLHPIQLSLTNARRNGTGKFEIDNFSLFGRLFIKMMEPPVRFKMKMPKAFSGKTITNKNDLLIDYISMQKKYISLLEESEGVDLTKIKIVSPAYKFIKFRLNEVFVFTAAHNRRHIWQAKNIIRHRYYPKD